MARRTYSQHLGDLAEVEIFARLLETGAAINGLTGTDTGWDLHLHVPDEIVTPMTGKTWTLSGHTAHVQVKFQSRPGALKVRLGTLRGWVSGSRAGTPTYVFRQIDQSLHYLTPCDLLSSLDAHLNSTDSKLVDLHGATWHHFSLPSFRRVLHFWRQYPQVPLAPLSALTDCHIADGASCSFDAALTATGNVLLGWIERCRPQILQRDDSTELSRHARDFAKPFLLTTAYDAIEQSRFEEGLQMYVMDNYRDWYGLDPSSYVANQGADIGAAATTLLDRYFA